MQKGEEWLKERTTGIGGSDAAVILGISPYKSRLELWEEKVTGKTIEKDNPDLHWGKKLEPFIIEEYIELTRRDVESGTYELENIRSKMYPWMLANLDGRITDRVKGKGVLECKTKSAYVKWKKEIPDHHYSQVQHYLATTGYSWASYCVLDFGKKELFWRDIERDEDFIKMLIEEESKFWQLVVDKTPPAVDGSKSCNEFLKHKYTEKPGKEIDLRNNSNASNWAFHLKQIKNEIKLLGEHELECKNNLMDMMADAENAIGNGYKIVWKSPKPSIIFNDKKFKLDYPELYKKYITPKEQTRRFTIRYDKEEYKEEDEEHV